MTIMILNNELLKMTFVHWQLFDSMGLIIVDIAVRLIYNKNENDFLKSYH